MFGNWDYEDEPDQLITYEWINRAYQVPHIPGLWRLGVVFARFSNDQTIFASFEGNTLRELKDFRDLSIDQPARYAEQLIHEWKINAENVGIDVVGVDTGVVDILKRNGLNVLSIAGSGSPLYLASEYLF